MDERKPSDEAARIVVRLPDGLRDRLAARARANGRSANAEAVMALEAWLNEEFVAQIPVEPIILPAMEERLASLISKAMDNALSNPDLLRRLHQLETARHLRTDDVTLEDETGRQFGPKDRLADAGVVEGGVDIYPPLIQGDHVPREDMVEHSRRSWERGMEERMAAIEKEKAKDG